MSTKNLKSLFAAVAVTTTMFFSFVAQADLSIEAWKNTKQLKLVERNSQGQFVDYGTLTQESWNDGDQTSEWVARHADGTFVSGYKGRLEKFKRRGQARESQVLTIRKANGQLVTWINMDDQLVSRWEKNGTLGWRYVIRAKDGRFVNWANAQLEDWNGKPVLVVRDTADDQNNGKILTLIYPTYDRNGSGSAQYIDQVSGQVIGNLFVPVASSK